MVVLTWKFLFNMLPIERARGPPRDQLTILYTILTWPPSLCGTLDQILSGLVTVAPLQSSSGSCSLDLGGLLTGLIFQDRWPTAPMVTSTTKANTRETATSEV